MINNITEFSLRNRFLIVLAYFTLAVAGYWAMLHTPVDEIPDLSENQVIVFTDWPGRSPHLLDDAAFSGRGREGATGTVATR